MFGILYMAVNAIAYMTSGIKMALDDNYHKRNSIEDERNKKVKTNTYMDHRGSTRDIYTNQLRYTNRDYDTGDVWLEDVHGRKIRNLSKEKRDIEFKENKTNNPGRKAVRYMEWDRSNSPIKEGLFKLTGDIYKDVNNGDLYIERNYISWRENLYPDSITNNEGKTYRASFYMKVSDGMLVGLNDREQPEQNSLYEKPTDEQIYEFILFFNRKQSEGGWKFSKERDEGKEIYKMDSKQNLYLC